MTRRLTIVLELDTRSSDRVRCGICPHLSAIQGEPMLSNGSRAQQTACDLFGAESDVPGDRVAACFAAERAAARMVEIDPKDAARVQVRSPKRQEVTSIEAHFESAMAKCNVTKALREHARKAGR